MKLLLIGLIIISLAIQARAQNSDSLRITAFEKNHPKYTYNELVKKYSAINQTVDTTEFEYLYYSKYRKNNFSYYDLSAGEQTFREKYNSKRYKESSELGIKLLQLDPTDLKTLLYTSISLAKIGSIDSSAILRNRLEMLIAIIKKYGDGRTKEKAFLTVTISDEHAILELTGSMFYNRKTEIANYFIFDSWDLYSVEKKLSYKLYFRFNSLYTAE